jgi:hypothetical protein
MDEELGNEQWDLIAPLLPQHWGVGEDWSSAEEFLKA